MAASPFVEVVVLLPVKAPGAAGPAFTYHLPDKLQDGLRVGSLVVVPFGPRRLYGIVVALSAESPVPETRPVESLVDPDPVLTPARIALARWMSREYLAPLYECLQAMLPPGVVGYADVLIALNPEAPADAANTEAQAALLAQLRRRGPLRGVQLGAALSDTDWRAAAEQLARRGVVTRKSFLAPPRARARQIRTARLVATDVQIDAFFAQLSSSKQADVLGWLVRQGKPSVPVEEICAEVNCTDATIRALAAKNWLDISPSRTIVAADIPPEGVDQFMAEYSRRAPSQVAIMAALRAGPQPVDELPGASYGVLRALEKKGLIVRTRQSREVSLTLSTEEARTRIAGLRDIDPYPAIVEFLRAEGGPVDVSWVYAETGCTRYHLDRLAERGLIVLEAEEVWRDPLAGQVFVPTEPPPLTPDQQAVWEPVASAIRNPQSAIFLLHGVTGSGKTEIYLRAVADVLAQGRRAIILVPEISLTPQTVARFAARFPGRVTVLHSALTEGERYDTWRRARAGLVDVVIGPRSALFSPLSPLGLIVLDEEHDGSYKQDAPRPCYHTRDAALELARLTGATVILGSATPSLESYHRARRGEFTLLEMPRRIMGHTRRLRDLQTRYRVPHIRYHTLRDGPAEARYRPLPPVQVVDLRAELRAGNRSIFSRALQRAMDEALGRGEQAILFLNRRGTATFVFCRDCGTVLRCPRCDTPLTYHGPRARLVCHYCNHREPQPGDCPRCGSKRIRYFGLGTERLEAAVRERWPDARILRWDRDTARSHAAHTTILQRFVDGAADVLVGTQMIAKGLDLPLVTVVGVISADTALNLPDFRSGERTFQLLTQVAGRAGRGLLGGRVVLQTYHPDHYAVVAAAAHDYAGFAARELAFRREQGYPPYRRLAKLVYEDTSPSRAQARAGALADTLREALTRWGLPETDLIGPAPPFFARLRGRYRWQVLLRHPNPAEFLRAVQIPPGWRVDVDPVSML
jgi:primosomal protein N' (replication factor Y)